MKLLLIIGISFFISVHLCAQPDNNIDLLAAVQNCDQDQIKKLVEDGADINQVDTNNASILMWSVKCNDETIVKYLVNNGARLENEGVIFEDTTRSSYFGNLTCIAAAIGNTSLLKYLIEDCGIYVDDKEYSMEDSAKTGWTALQWASYNGKINSLGYLLSRGANLNTNQSTYKFTPLHLAVFGGSVETMKILISNGAEVNLGDYNGWTPLHYACRDGYQDVIEDMINVGANVNIQTGTGYTPLMLAAYNNGYEICEILVKNGADIHWANHENLSAISMAQLQGNSEVVNFLNDPKNYERKLSWMEINSKFLKAFRKKDYGTSLELAKQAEKQASKEFGKNDLNYSVALNNLAVAYEMAGNYDEALMNYERSLSIKEEITGKENEDYISALKNLAGTYSKLGQYDKSVEMYREACELRKKLNGENDFEYLNDLIYLSNTYKKIREYQKADSVLNIIISNLAMKEEIDDSFFELKVRAIRGRGFIYTLKREYPKAEEYFLEALDIVKSRKGEFNKQYTTSLEYLANVYYDADKTDEAIFVYKKIIEINEFLDGEKSYTHAYDLSNLGNVYTYTGEFMLADSILNLASNIALEVLGEYNIDYVSILKDFAILYKQQGKNDEAAIIYEKVLSIQKDILGGLHPDYIATLSSYAGNYGIVENYEDAFKYYQKVIDLQKEVYGENSLEISNTYNNVGMLYKKKGDLDESYQYLFEALKVREEKLGDTSYEFAVTLSGVAGIYQYWCRFDTAEILFKKVLSIDSTLFGPNSISASMDYYNLGLLYQEIGEYKKAEIAFNKTLEIRKKELGEKHNDIVETITSIGLNYEYLGDYNEARKYLDEALAINKEIYGTTSIKYGLSLMKLGVLDNLVGDYVIAESRMLEALEIYKNVYGSDSWFYGRSLTYLTNIYRDKGDFSKAEEILYEVLEIYENSIGTENITYINAINLLGVLYRETGDYKSAEHMFLNALELLSKIFDKKNDDYATILNSLAMIYEYLGNYDKAKDMYYECLAIRLELFGEDNIDYADTKNGLGVFYDKTGEYQKSIEYLNDAIEIYKNVVGDKSPQYIISISNLSMAYNHIGEYEKAVAYAEEALALKKELYGEDHPDYALGLNNLAINVKDQEDYEYAIELYKQAVEIRKNSFGVNHPTYPIYLHNLADTYECLGDYDKAEEIYYEANECMINQIEYQFSFLSEEEKKFFIDDIKYRFDVYYSFFLRSTASRPELAGNSFNNALTMKGLLLRAEQQVRNSILNSEDTSLIKKYNEWSSLKGEIASLYSMPIGDNQQYINDLEDKATSLEKELARLSEDFTESNQTKDSWQDIQKNLNKSEAAVEFVRFQYYNKYWTDSTYYCALLLLKDSKYPKIIQLFEEKELQASFQKSDKNNVANLVAQLYGEQRGAGLLNSEESISYSDTVLYNMIWQPLEDHLDDVEKIYYSPSGLLHKVSFAAIPYNDSFYLSDLYALNYLSSSGFLTEKNKPVDFSSEQINAVVYGGIEYDVNEDEMLAESRKYIAGDETLLAINRSSSFNNDTRGMNWNYLQGTLVEANNIEEQFEQNNISTSLYTSKEANEESFKALSGQDSPEIIHLATHGFFFPDPKQQYLGTEENIEQTTVFQQSGNPLMRSGMILAGGNNVWQGEQVPDGVEDGILTALEVSGMNLSNTKLVVLSACETGLGDIQGSEGVYGLQRAFKMAGVDYLIMSLWQVPDKETQEFMGIFYEQWLATHDIRGAFKFTQDEMKKKYDPFYWAAFVLIE